MTMKYPKRAIILSLTVIVVFIGSINTALAAESGQKAPATLDNLIKAFNGESNAHAKYLAFAKKADEEGFGQAASLFRAAAAAEEIHLTAHSVVIKSLGGEAKADIKPAEVKSTKDNLETAFKGESYERDTMYPEFIAQAQKDNVENAVESFRHARDAEAVHAKLYQEALANLDAQKGGPKDYYVCLECGNVVTQLAFEKCPICGNPKEKFKKVS